MTILAAELVKAEKTLLYVVPEAKTAEVRVLVTNTGTDTTVNVWAVAKGGGAGKRHLLMSDFAIAASDSDMTALLVLDEGESIYADSGNNIVAFQVVGRETFVKRR